MRSWSKFAGSPRLWFTGVCTALVCATVLTWAQGELQTSVVVLLDFSASFAPLTAEDEQALDTLADSLLQRSRGDWTPPVLVRWAVIGSSSLFTAPPCGPAIQFEPKLLPGLGKSNSSTHIGDADVFRVWLHQCIQQSMKRSRSAEKYTDISGALALAAETGSGAKQKFVVVLSDFVEDREPGAQPLALTLKGEKVVMLYRPEANDRLDPAKLFNRLAEWEKRLMAAGASGVCRVRVSDAVSGSLLNCLK